MTPFPARVPQEQFRRLYPERFMILQREHSKAWVMVDVGKSLSDHGFTRYEPIISKESAKFALNGTFSGATHILVFSSARPWQN